MRGVRGSARPALLAGAILLGAAGLLAQPTSAASSGVAIVDFAFSPASISVHAGDTVVWTNTGAAMHTVTADAGGFDSGLLPSGGSFTFTFTAAGTYAYHCNVHPTMHGTIVVQGAASAPAQPHATRPTTGQAPAAPTQPATRQAPAPQARPAAPGTAQARSLPATGTGGGATDDRALLAAGGAVALLVAALLLRRLAWR